MRIYLAFLTSFAPSPVMAIVDSKAAFASRLAVLGLDDVMSEFTKFGWDTFSSFTFSCQYTPGVC